MEYRICMYLYIIKKINGFITARKWTRAQTWGRYTIYPSVLEWECYARICVQFFGNSQVQKARELPSRELTYPIFLGIKTFIFNGVGVQGYIYIYIYHIHT